MSGATGESSRQSSGAISSVPDWVLELPDYQHLKEQVRDVRRGNPSELLDESVNNALNEFAESHSATVLAHAASQFAAWERASNAGVDAQGIVQALRTTLSDMPEAVAVVDRVAADDAEPVSFRSVFNELEKAIVQDARNLARTPLARDVLLASLREF